MNESQIAVVLGLALPASVIAIVLFPHPRRVEWFEAILWLGTFLVAMLGGILGMAAADGLPILRESSSLLFFETPIVPTALGALGGALVVNIPLSLLGRSQVQETAEADSEMNSTASADVQNPDG